MVILSEYGHVAYQTKWLEENKSSLKNFLLGDLGQAGEITCGIVRCGDKIQPFFVFKRSYA